MVEKPRKDVVDEEVEYGEPRKSMSLQPKKIPKEIYITVLNIK